MKDLRRVPKKFSDECWAWAKCPGSLNKRNESKRAIRNQAYWAQVRKPDPQEYSSAQHEFELPHLSPYSFGVGLGLGNPSPKGVFMFIFKRFGFILFGSISSSSSLYSINS
jgi:hypothetical protein